MKRLCLDCGALTHGSRCAPCLAALEARMQAKHNAEMGGSGGAWQAMRREVVQRQEGRCARCGNELGTSWEVDHVVPRAVFRARGEPVPAGTANLQALCKPCHQAKTVAQRRMRRNGVAI